MACPSLTPEDGMPSPLESIGPPAGLSVVIRAKIESGRLPMASPVKVWVGPGNERPCDVCERPILPVDLEYETDMPDGRTIRFDQACLTAWHQERAAFLRPITFPR